MPIVSAGMSPIQLKDLRAGALKEISVDVPLVRPDLTTPKFVSHDPLVMAPETLEQAADAARRVIDGMKNLPHNQQAADLLAMAYAVLHYDRLAPKTP